MRRRGIAIHWQIFIGLALGIGLGLVLNYTWDGDTWARLGVHDREAWLQGRPNSLKEPEGKAARVAAAWLLASLEAEPTATVEPELDRLTGDGVTGAEAEKRVRRAAAWMLAPVLGDAAGTGEEGAGEREELREWLRPKLAELAEAPEPAQVRSAGLPEEGRPREAVAAFVQSVDPAIATLVHPNEAAGAGAMAARFIANSNDFVGRLFIRVLRFIAVPIVLFSLIVGASSLNDVKKMSRIGGKTILIYLCTTSIAITVGLVLANTLKPGSRISEEMRNDIALTQAETAQVAIGKAAEKPTSWTVLLNVVPENPFEALAKAEMLQVVITALLIGIALTLIPREKARPVMAFCDGMTDVIIKIVHVLMLLAPYAVFALIVKMIADMGLDLLKSLAVYCATVMGGLLIIILGVYPAFLKVFTPVGYRRFFRAMAPAQLLAFSSSSSAATLPVTMKCAEHRLGVSEEVSSFVLPLGATINMDGTAMLQGVAAVFIAQLFGLPLTMLDQLAIVLTATLASIGTAAVPSAGMVMLVIVLQSIRIPPEAMVTGIAVIFSVDRLLDMSRTVVNITGDSMVAAVVAHSEGELLSEEEVERGIAERAAAGLDEHPQEDD